MSFTKKIVGFQAGLKRVRERMELVLNSEVAVLIWGERGTGHDTMARWIHEHSPRSNGLFVKVDCATLTPEILVSQFFDREAFSVSESMLNRVNHGTLYLDRIDRLPLASQVAFSRLFESLAHQAVLLHEFRVLASSEHGLVSEPNRFSDGSALDSPPFPDILTVSAGSAVSAFSGEGRSEENQSKSLASNHSLNRTEFPGESTAQNASPNLTERAFFKAKNPSEPYTKIFFDSLTRFFGGFPIYLPTLAERQDEISDLAQFFAEEAALDFGFPLRLFSPAQIDQLAALTWPDNVRGLRSMIRRAVESGRGRRIALADTFGSEFLPENRAKETRSKSNFVADSNRTDSNRTDSNRTDSNRTDSGRADWLKTEGMGGRKDLGKIGDLEQGIPQLGLKDLVFTRENFPSLDTAMIHHIKAALKLSKGAVEGSLGAAQLLKINPYTLRARMKKLGIELSEFRTMDE